MDDLEKMEQKVSDLVKKNDTTAAIRLLLELVKAYAKAKNFAKAEAMREKMFKVDSMALNEIIQSAEIIESEKSKAINLKHRRIWSKLYNILSQEESNALYFELKEKTFKTDEILFSCGDFNSNLYFINQGKLKLVYNKGEKETLLKSMRDGEVAGENTFFAASVCTASLITMSPVNLNYLERKRFEELKSKFPGLEHKLMDFIKTFKNTNDLIKSMKLNRREDKRIAVEGVIYFKLINSVGSPTGNTFRGNLSDISLGGLSFFISSANPKNSRILLGRKLHLQFVLNVEGKDHKVEKEGIVSSVISQLFQSYSIHIKFHNLLDESLIQNL